MYDDEFAWRLENAVTWFEQQRQQEQQLAETTAWAGSELARIENEHPDVNVAEYIPYVQELGGDFDAAYQVYSDNRPAPRTVSDAVDNLAASMRAANRG